MEASLKLSERLSKRQLYSENSCNSEIYWTLYSFFSGIKNTPPLQSFKSRLDQAAKKYIARNTAILARK